MHPERRFHAPPAAHDVYVRATPAWTLAALEQALGYETRGAEGMEAEWLEAVRQVPMITLADDDLARLLERGMHVPVLQPIALERLRAALASRVPPSLELIRACGVAARMVSRTAPAIPRQTREVLGALQQIPWPAQRDEVQAAVRDALT